MQNIELIKILAYLFEVRIPTGLRYSTMTGAAGALCNCSSDLEKSLKLSSALELKTGVRSGKVG